ncbi:hypothetical protein GJ496_001806 [Pomphorhynchus laevis]|nr:hypothetical protein GJ496_001806 [Pomphorhynchus laevis]
MSNTSALDTRNQDIFLTYSTGTYGVSQNRPEELLLLENSSSLFASLLSIDSDSEKLAEEWISSYLSCDIQGTTEFVQLLISGSGVPSKISECILFNDSFESFLDKLEKSFSSVKVSK